MTSKKIQAPYRIRRYLSMIFRLADAHRKYRWAIDIYNRYRKKYVLDWQFEYNLGLFYDHLVIFKTSRIKDKSKRERLTKLYLGEALLLYEGILKTEPSNVLALRGLGRVHEAQGDYVSALRYALKAYKLLQRTPKPKRGSLAIGNIYLQQKKYHRAEEWFKKELVDLGENNFGANANLMIFYDVIGNYKKALPFALRTEKLLAKEATSYDKKKKQNASNNKTFRSLLFRIQHIKQKAQKSSSH